ncbi:MerR family transcriptional regulator [candidate division WOR-3 bacterium]|nr:MerR family transcriptional regulator [candidate division WOR-3 bacterium]
MRKFFSKKKVYYSISEVAKKAGVNPYVLRFWEDKFFPFLKPKKDKSGRRRYTSSDLDVVLAIVDLLYVKRFTIEGAVKELQLKFSTGAKAAKISSAQKTKMVIKEVKKTLKDLRSDLKKSGFYFPSEKKIGADTAYQKELDAVQLNLFSDDIS